MVSMAIVISDKSLSKHAETLLKPPFQPFKMTAAEDRRQKGPDTRWLGREEDETAQTAQVRGER